MHYVEFCGDKLCVSLNSVHYVEFCGDKLCVSLNSVHYVEFCGDKLCVSLDSVHYVEFCGDKLGVSLDSVHYTWYFRSANPHGRNRVIRRIMSATHNNSSWTVDGRDAREKDVRWQRAANYIVALNPILLIVMWGRDVL